MNQDVGASESMRTQLMNLLAFRLYQCGNLLSKTGTKAMEPHGVTTQQWAVIGVLARDQKASEIAVHQLASVLMVSRQNLTGVLSRMESRGLIERKHCKKDSRSRLICLTQKGWECWEEMQGTMVKFYDVAMQNFSSNDLIHALHYLELMRTNMSELDNAEGA